MIAVRQEGSIRLRERLSVAAELLRGSHTVADIGCDHGRLSCALVQSGAVRRCIAVDVSAPSLEKARRLADAVGIGELVETRLGDGFAPIAPGEADAVALLGMGGTLMARLLDRCERPLNGARLAVLQPMCAVDDIRRYLFETGYPMLDDRVAAESGRLYQIFCVGVPEKEPQKLPPHWPADCFLLGYRAFEAREPLMRALAERMLMQREKRLRAAVIPALMEEAAQLRQILQFWERG